MSTTDTQKVETETIDPAQAARTLLDEIEANGFMKMIDLDPYFGTVEIPLEKEIGVLSETYPEDFAFFKAFLDDIREEMELHFEVTDLYEDEEFDQFVEDCRIIRERYTRDFAEKHLETLRSFVKKVAG